MRFDWHASRSPFSWFPHRTCPPAYETSECTHLPTDTRTAIDASLANDTAAGPIPSPPLSVAFPSKWLILGNKRYGTQSAPQCAESPTDSSLVHCTVSSSCCHLRAVRLPRTAAECQTSSLTRSFIPKPASPITNDGSVTTTATRTRNSCYTDRAHQAWGVWTFICYRKDRQIF